ncbi:septum formation initiator [Jiangella asiatica]|uniref:Septum formation initiator n=1 Tax=Jiangella asiatica TaxID=2530372 RepID=A0A4R5CMQ2_9ACTN|nr:septum formation initiator [Jiangella asiatica]TDE00587.1 septum formation initiator [Jiangella asiatica]
MGRARWVRVGTVVLLWLAAAAGATAAGLAAVGMIGSDIFGSSQDPLTQSEVAQRLASPEPTAPDATSPTAAPTGTPSPSPSPSATQPPVGESRVVNTAAGTVIARCVANGLVEIQSATPAQGYDVDTDDGDEDHPSVKFENDSSEIEVRLRCVDGVIDPEIRTDTDD